MEKLNITKTRKLNLCISCEICSAVCPVEVITMEYKFGQFFPKVNDEKCTNCGLCLEVCPGIDIDPLKLRYEKISDNTFYGHYLESYTAYSNDPEIRKNSTSGGLVTGLLINSIENKEFDYAFVLNFDKFDNKPVRLKATNKIDEILNSAKSKYIPASVYNVIKTLKNGDNKRYIIVGTPCQIYGIKKFVKKFNNISEENLLFLGLFCEQTLNFNIVRFFEDTYRKSNEKLIKFEFRTKEKFGWPGNSKVYFDSGREMIIDRKVRMQLKKIFLLNRCLFCFDKLNRWADIAFGDCYIIGKDDFNGKSSVIIRTNKGKKIFDKYSYLFTIEEENIDTIRSAQRLDDKKSNLEYAKVFIKRCNIYPDDTQDFEINTWVLRNLIQLEKYIKWGKNYNYFKIKHTMLLSKIRGKLKNIYSHIRKIIQIGIIVCESFLIYIFAGKRKLSTKKRSGDIIIVGGELFNKGAQAMTFTTVDQIKKRFPYKSIYLFSTRDFYRKDEEKNIYKFNILPWDLTTKIRLLSFWNKLFKKNFRFNYLDNKTREIIKNANFIIDVSGFCLSSQFKFSASFNYLLNLIVAKKYSIPYYIFPQSIGPFDYLLKHKIFLYPLMKLYLKYPKIIFLREKEGLTCVHKFTKKNVEKKYDIVLQNKGYNLANIYNKNVHLKDIKIETNSVAIIPNLRVIERTNQDELYHIYNSLIKRLIDAKKIAYILRHSYEDLEVCKKIKKKFLYNKNVISIVDDLNAIELERIIRQFDFVIASRYHSIIHSYKNGIPALVIGWATKYFELLKDFDQLDYFFDCRNDIDICEINNKTNKMINNYECEKEKIKNKLIMIDNQRYAFDIFA